MTAQTISSRFRHPFSLKHSSGAAKSPYSRRPIVSRRIFHSTVYLLAFIFILLVQLGNTSKSSAIVRQTYFLKVDLTNIIPQSVPDAMLINSIARTIGLHDFYQVGLWNFCEGYGDGSGVTSCSTPRHMYFFNPVEILMNELLAGATVAMPVSIMQALKIVRIASNWMFAFFLASIILIFLCVLLTPFSVLSPTSTADSPSESPAYEKPKARPIPKRMAFPLSILAFGAFFTTAAGSILATAMFAIFKTVISNNEANLNIHAEIGTRMLGFMWVSVALVTLGFILQARNLCSSCCGCCCCLPCFRTRSRSGQSSDQGSTSGQGVRTDPGLAGSDGGPGRENEKSTSHDRGFTNVTNNRKSDTKLHPWRRMRLGV